MRPTISEDAGRSLLEKRRFENIPGVAHQVDCPWLAHGLVRYTRVTLSLQLRAFASRAALPSSATLHATVKQSLRQAASCCAPQHQLSALRPAAQRRTPPGRRPRAPKPERPARPQRPPRGPEPRSQTLPQDSLHESKRLRVPKSPGGTASPCNRQRGGGGTWHADKQQESDVPTVLCRPARVRATGGGRQGVGSFALRTVWCRASETSAQLGGQAGSSVNSFEHSHVQCCT